MSVPLLSFFFWYQIGIILVRMALAVSPYINAVQQREPVRGAHVCLFVFSRVFLYCRIFAHEKMSVRVNARHSKVEDGADSLCAVYYRILCNYIITANHPPEVA